MSKKRRNYTREFKQEALQLWETSGKSAQQIEADLGITHGLLYKWRGDVATGRRRRVSRAWASESQRCRSAPVKTGTGRDA